LRRRERRAPPRQVRPDVDLVVLNIARAAAPPSLQIADVAGPRPSPSRPKLQCAIGAPAAGAPRSGLPFSSRRAALLATGRRWDRLAHLRTGPGRLAAGPQAGRKLAAVFCMPDLARGRAAGTPGQTMDKSTCTVECQRAVLCVARLIGGFPCPSRACWRRPAQHPARSVHRLAPTRRARR
jgi:hypothetical protein